jgi:phosphohistidine phosphatase
MALYLIQHGKALPQEQDSDRRLSPEGRTEAETMAATVHSQRIAVRRIEHSGKPRARETAEIFAAALYPADGVGVRAGLNPNDDVTALAPSLRAGDNLMLIGHLPFMERLAAFLVAGDPDRLIVKFQNAGVVALDQDPAGHWHLLWALTPSA